MKRPSFTSEPFDSVVLAGISPPFEELSRIQRQVAHVLLTRSPLYSPEGFLVRLACVRHAASVRSEPGSNSPIDISVPKGKIPYRFPSRLPIPLGSIGNCTTEPVQVRHISYSFFKEQIFSKQEGIVRIPTVDDSCQPANACIYAKKQPGKPFSRKGKLSNHSAPTARIGCRFPSLFRLAKYSGSKSLCQRKNLNFFVFFHEIEMVCIYLFLLCIFDRKRLEA